MSLLASARRDLGTTTVKVLARNTTSRKWEPTERTVEVASLDLGGTELAALGMNLDTQMRRLFCDLDVDGESPITLKDRVGYEGEPDDGFGWSVVSVKRVPKGRDRGAIVEIRKES